MVYCADGNSSVKECSLLIFRLQNRKTKLIDRIDSILFYIEFSLKPSMYDLIFELHFRVVSAYQCRKY